MPQKLAVWRNVGNVVPLVVRRRHRAIQTGSRVPERCVDEPPLSLTGPDRPAIPGPSVLGLTVPLEVSDVSGFEVDSVPVMGTQDRNACVRTFEHWNPSGVAASFQRRGRSITWQVIA